MHFQRSLFTYLMYMVEDESEFWVKWMQNATIKIDVFLIL